MKIYGIFRGFAGLGRVVAGLGLLNKLKTQGHDVKLFTYAQGITIASQYGYRPMNVKERSDIGFMGIVPISPTGLSVIDDILNWKPDCILVDGEPLMIECLRLSGVYGKIIALTNPLDLHSEKNNPVTMNYFRHLFGQSDAILCHGIHNIEACLETSLKAKVFCMNTILREEVLSIKRDNPQLVNCILGGGTKNCSQDFISSTLEIASRVILVAKHNPNINFNIYCNDRDIADNVKKLFPPTNLNIVEEYTSPSVIYRNSRIVIGRAGRNTISELLFLKIPAIVIPISSDVVSIEQNNNIKYASELSNNNIVGCSLHDAPTQIIGVFNSILKHKTNYDDWIPGNSKAYDIIRRICKFKD